MRRKMREERQRGTGNDRWTDFLGRCQDKFAVLTKNIKVRRGEPEGEYHTEKVL